MYYFWTTVQYVTGGICGACLAHEFGPYSWKFWFGIGLLLLAIISTSFKILYQNLRELSRCKG